MVSVALHRPSLAKASTEPPASAARPSKILVIDIGGTKVKFLATGQHEPRKMNSSKKLTPGRMVEVVKEMTEDWAYEAISIGYPGLVGTHGPRSEPGNLGSGWVGFNFPDAFGCPVRIINDAAMQALGSYEGGRMLFLGLGTGLGSTLIVENIVVSLELGNLPYKNGTNLGELLGKAGLEKLGKDKWVEIAQQHISALAVAFSADYVVLGGGNAAKLKGKIPGIRLGHNLTAFRGGMRLWNIEQVPTHVPEGEHPIESKPPAEWRVM